MRTMTGFAAVLGLALGTTALAQDKKDDKSPDVRPITDAEFVIFAASGGWFEVESGKIAKDAAKGADVKKFAEQMVTDHQKANKALIEVAKKANLGIPIRMLETDEQMLARVRGAKGADFDKVYMDTQVVAHEDAVSLFTRASKHAKDAGVKAFAEKTLPTLKKHLEQARKVSKTDGKKAKDDKDDKDDKKKGTKDKKKD